MNKNDLIELLPRIHNLNMKSLKKKGQKGFTKYQVLTKIGIEPNTNNYRKLTECIDMGFLVLVNDNPPEYKPDRDKIWDFWKQTPSGSECKKMIEGHVVTFE